MTSEATVIKAYEAGINFFFLSADAHWTHYHGIRAGLSTLLSDNPGRRSELVVAIVSYFDEPFFHQAGQFAETVAAVPGLGYADILVAGATTGRNLDRMDSLTRLKASSHCGSRGVGATFHHRPSALAAANAGHLDLSYVRYNTGYSGARTDIFPHLCANRQSLLFTFKSVTFPVTAEEFSNLPAAERLWLPKVEDYYRFPLSDEAVNGILCSPGSPHQLATLLATLDKEPLSTEEQDYMIRLSSLAHHSNSLASRVSAWWDNPVETPAKPVGSV